MRKVKIILILGCSLYLTACGNTEAECPEVIKPATEEELREAYDPNKAVAGGAKNIKYDCRYLNPPKIESVFNKALFDCELAKISYDAVRKGCHYYESHSTVRDGPIWCLIPLPRNETEEFIRKSTISAYRDTIKYACK